MLESDDETLTEEQIDDFLDRLEKAGFFYVGEKKALEILENENKIAMIRYAENQLYDGIMYKDAFEGFFSNPKWRYFEGKRDGSDDIVETIEFTGGCLYREKEVTALVQFELNEDEGKFQVVYLSFNDVPQDALIISGLIDKVFSDAQLNAKKVKPIN